MFVVEETQITDPTNDGFSITDYLTTLIIVGSLLGFAFFWFYLKPKHEKQAGFRNIKSMNKENRIKLLESI